MYPCGGGLNQTLHGVWSKEPTTLFPAAIAMGATWIPNLIHTITDGRRGTRPLKQPRRRPPLKAFEHDISKEEDRDISTGLLNYLYT
jgi:hypothetical protein